jgi:hypothetical protein
MKKLMQFTIAIALVLGVAASLMPAQAACSSARVISTLSSSGDSHLFTPGNPFKPNYVYNQAALGGSVTYYVNGVFWSWGGGNPVVGLGNDNGSLKGGWDFTHPPYLLSSNWLKPGYAPNPPDYPGYAAFIGGQFSHWQYPGTDGCIDKDGTNTGLPDVGECNVVLLNDMNGDNAYFAALAVTAQGAGTGAFEYTPGSGFPASISLAPVPKPTIVSSTNGVGSVTLTVGLPAGSTSILPANGFYLQCHAADTLAGWKLYTRTIPAGTPKPSQVNSRALGPIPGKPFPALPPWVSVTANEVAIGATTQLTVPCSDTPGSAQDVFLCATLTFGGTCTTAACGGTAQHYELKYCSPNSTRITCDPNLADPHPKPGMHRIERPTQKGHR